MPNQVIMLAYTYTQAFSLDWAFFKLAKNISYISSLDWAFLKKCPIKGKCLRIIEYSYSALKKIGNIGFNKKCITKGDDIICACMKDNCIRIEKGKWRPIITTTTTMTTSSSSSSSSTATSITTCNFQFH